MSADPGFLIGLVVGSMLAACAEFAPRAWATTKTLLGARRCDLCGHLMRRRRAGGDGWVCHRIHLDHLVDQSRPANRRSTTE